MERRRLVRGYFLLVVALAGVGCGVYGEQLTPAKVAIKDSDLKGVFSSFEAWLTGGLVDEDAPFDAHQWKDDYTKHLLDPIIKLTSLVPKKLAKIVLLSGENKRMISTAMGELSTLNSKVGTALKNATTIMDDFDTVYKAQGKQQAKKLAAQLDALRLTKEALISAGNRSQVVYNGIQPKKDFDLTAQLKETLKTGLLVVNSMARQLALVLSKELLQRQKKIA